MSVKDKHIVIYTSYYPFTKMSESFLTPELKVAVNNGFHITIVPVNKNEYSRGVPEDVVVDKSLYDSSLFYRFISLISIIHYYRFVEFSELSKCIKLKYLIDSIKYLYAANLIYRDIIKRTKDKAFNYVFYSYWLSYPPIGFAFYKFKHPKTPYSFISRGHGSDIYGIDAGVFYPLRKFVFSYIDKIYSISEHGRDYLLSNYKIDSQKIVLSRLGVYNNENINPYDNSELIRVVSCSNIIPLKRVSLIFRSLQNYASRHLDSHVEWVHFGDGELKRDIEEKVLHNTISNFSCKLLGILSNEEILKYYREIYVTAFVLLSTSEGIPVSIMEAISSGIPVIATNVGGVSEIVNNQTGFLLNRDFSQDEFDNALNSIVEKRVFLSKSAHSFFLSNYSAEKNFKEFYIQIVNNDG